MSGGRRLLALVPLLLALTGCAGTPAVIVPPDGGRPTAELVDECPADVSVPPVKAAAGDRQRGEWKQAEREQPSRADALRITGMEDECACIVRWLYARGLSAEAACGIAANIARETGGTYDPLTVNDIGAVGLCQWLGVRAARLYQREDWDSVEGQLAYLLEELAGTESGVDLSGSAYDCGYNFARDYERTGVPGTYADRGALAEELYGRIG